MSIVPQSQSFSFTFSPPQVPLLPAPPVRLMLPAPKIAGLLPAPIEVLRPKVVRLEVAQTPENRVRLAGSLDEFVASLGHWWTLADADALFERHAAILKERLAVRRAEGEARINALNAWWDEYLAATEPEVKLALLAKKRELSAAEVI